MTEYLNAKNKIIADNGLLFIIGCTTYILLLHGVMTEWINFYYALIILQFLTAIFAMACAVIMVKVINKIHAPNKTQNTEHIIL